MLGLGFEPSTTLDEAVRAAENNDEDNIKRMLHSVDERLQVLATGGDVMLEDTVSAEQFEKLIDMLLVKCPVVVVDVSHSASALQKCVISPREPDTCSFYADFTRFEAGAKPYTGNTRSARRGS